MPTSTKIYRGMLLDIKERMQAVLQAEARAIEAINITDDFERAVRVMQACKGKIITTGIGKAGYIAKKFAATLCSTATPADFIHPAEAAHGDHFRPGGRHRCQ